MNLRRRLTAVSLALLMAACQSLPDESLPLADDVDLDRFMGDWYVIASIPTFLEEGAHNAVESYERTGERQVATTFRFREDGFDGPLETYRPTGFVSEENNAVWGMQFMWPIKAEYLIVYLDDDYQRTVIGRSARDYVWLMARDPEPSPDAYQEMLDAAAAAGYDPAKIRRVPQRWPEPG